MGQVLSAVLRFLGIIDHNHSSTEKGQTTLAPAVAGGDAPVLHQSSELVMTNTKENDVIPSEIPPRNRSSDLSAELVAPKQEPVGGGTPAQGEHQIFALVIGIDEYKFVEPKQDLQGAVKDAEEFNKYLLNDRGVPEANIINLRNGWATRSAIIEAFIKLKNNPRITPGDVTIIIYFAGHGTVARKPSAWKNWETPDDKVEMLCPADINHDLNGKDRVEGIPDRTLSRLLLDLSKAKGNNITLILDCCHAAGMNRGSNDPALRSRALNLKGIQDLSPTCDKDIYSPESLTTSVQEGVSYFGSHVLLAACRRTQSAWEDGNNGIFTTTLLRSLRDVASSNVQPTYDSLMNGLPPMRGDQTPHWDGKHVHRFVFDSWRVPACSSMILCYHGNRGSPWPSDLVLQAGSLHGITIGSTFEIFGSPSPRPNMKDLITTLTVTEVKHSISRLELTSSDPTAFPSNSKSFWYARLRKASDNSPLHIYCDDQGTLDLILVDTPESWLTAHVIPVEDPDDADICLTVEANIVHFNQGKRAGTRIEFSSYFPPYSPCPVHAMPDIRDFINRYAHFTSRLIIKSPAATTDFVTVEMNKLQFDEDEGEVKKDSQVTLTTVKDGELFKIVVDTAQYPDPYGFTIRQNGGVDLYAYLLYFDASKLTIDTWYHPQKGQMNREGSVDPCLSNNSPLTLGYGRSIMNPMSFGVPDGQNEDICFVKIFVATKAVDIGPIEQFESCPDLKPRDVAPWTPPPSNIKWASKKFTIISERRPSVDSLQVAKENALSNSEESELLEGVHPGEHSGQ